MYLFYREYIALIDSPHFFQEKIKCFASKYFFYHITKSPIRRLRARFSGAKTDPAPIETLILYFELMQLLQ